MPALAHLANVIRDKAARDGDIVKTGRTHLMDAMPVTLAQEMGAWASQIEQASRRLEQFLPELESLAIGGTAVGTGINTPDGFGKAVSARLAALTGRPFAEAPDHFSAQASSDTAAAAGGLLEAVAVSLMKIANDLRWMNSGPKAGFRGDYLAGLAAWFEHHAREDQSGDPGSSDHGLGAGDGQRSCDQHGSPRPRTFSFLLPFL